MTTQGSGLHFYYPSLPFVPSLDPISERRTNCCFYYNNYYYHYDSLLISQGNSNWPCKSSCLLFPRAGITGIHHHDTSRSSLSSQECTRLMKCFSQSSELFSTAPMFLESRHSRHRPWRAFKHSPLLRKT